MKLVRQIGSLILVSVFLFGVSGLSVFHHSCASSGTDKVALYAGIFKAVPASCCEDENEPGIANSAADHGQGFDATPCCKSTNLFLALHVVSETVSVLHVTATAVPAHVELPLLPVPEAVSQVFIKEARYQFHSPPLYGIDLIHFLHQIKIPASPVLS